MKFVDPATSAAQEQERGLDLDHLLSDRRWEPLLDLLPDGLVLVDRTGFVRFVNSAAENITELLRPEVIGRSLQALVKQSQADIGVALEAFSAGAKTSQVVTNSVRQNYLLTTRCVRSWAGEMTCFVIVLRDAEQLVRAAPDGALGGFAETSDSRGIAELVEADEAMILCADTALLVERGLKALNLGSRLLLLGESGAGKTELARVLHRESGAPGRPFVHVNCGSIPETLFESEMFGYERGSFTGASAKGKKGLVEAAEGGVLFLDEVGEIPLPAQAKMLHFLEDSAVHKVGATHSRRLRLQIIAATNRDLYAMVTAGTFRRDLYYRLNVVALTLPPLRRRPDVIDKLVDRLLARLNRRRSPPLRIESASRRRLRAHAFPGNVRELQNLMEHFAVVCDRVVTESDVAAVLAERLDPAAASMASARPGQRLEEDLGGGTLKDVVREFETRVVRAAIQRAGSKRKAAEFLGVDIATVVRKSRVAPR